MAITVTITITITVGNAPSNKMCGKKRQGGAMRGDELTTINNRMKSRQNNEQIMLHQITITITNVIAHNIQFNNNNTHKDKEQ